MQYYIACFTINCFISSDKIAAVAAASLINKLFLHLCNLNVQQILVLLFQKTHVGSVRRTLDSVESKVSVLAGASWNNNSSTAKHVSGTHRAN